MAQLCRDLFTPATGTYESLIGHEGTDITWAAIDDLNDAGISPADIFMTPGGTAFHGGYSTTLDAVSNNPAFQVSEDGYDSTDIVCLWDIMYLGAYHPSHEDNGGVDQDPVRPYDDESVGVTEFWFDSPADIPSWVGISTDGTSNNGSTTSSIQLWVAMDDGDYTGFYLQHDGATLALYRSDDGVTQVLLDSVSHTPVVGTTYTVKFERHSNQIRIYIDDASQFMVTDSAYSGGNLKVGLAILGGSSPVRGWHVDSMVLYEESVAPPTVGTPVLSGSNSDADTVSLSWTAATNATSYELYRQNPGGSWRLIYSGTATSYVDTGRAIGYWKYRVRGIGASSNAGAYSNILTVYVETQTFIGPEVDDVGDTDQTRVIVRAYKALDWDDAIGGRICPVSGMWFPKHRLKSVDGVQVGEDYAHLRFKPVVDMPEEL